MLTLNMPWIQFLKRRNLAKMSSLIQAYVMEVTGASGIQLEHSIQSLWSGYGAIRRYTLKGAFRSSVVVKEITSPSAINHPRGWNSSLSHERKLKSYFVESLWYEQWAQRCDDACRIPQCFGVREIDGGCVLVLEDLDEAGFPGQVKNVDLSAVKVCLSWLAQFHALFLNEIPTGLWDVGTYWHLDTRPDELQVLESEDPHLYQYADEIDMILRNTTYQTLVHGDAKLANFCFSSDQRGVAAVDFQYVGGGCGMKDVVYFLGSCLDEEACEGHEAVILDHYFKVFRDAVHARDMCVDLAALESEWRLMYPVAWADFHRFLKGWSPGHWKVNAYSERLVKEVLQLLKGP